MSAETAHTVNAMTERDCLVASLNALIAELKSHLALAQAARDEAQQDVLDKAQENIILRGERSELKAMLRLAWSDASGFDPETGSVQISEDGWLADLRRRVREDRP